MKNEKKGNKVTKEIKETLGEIFTKEYVKQMLITASVVIAVIVFCYFFQNTIVTFISGFLVVTAIIIYFAVKHYLKTKENTNINTCSSCGACWRKSEYITRIVYEVLYSLRKMYEFEVPRSEELIQSSEPDSPLFDSKYGFPVNLSRLWFKTLWSHIKTPEELESFDVNEFRAILRKEIIDLFNTHRIWFSESPITGLWVDLVKIDPYSIRIMIIPYCNGVTSAYLNARYEEEIRSNEQEGRCDNTVVYDDEMG